MTELKQWYMLQKAEKDGLTQGAIAQKAGIQRQYLNEIMSGKQHPSRKLALRLQEITGISVYSIMFPKELEPAG